MRGFSDRSCLWKGIRLTEDVETVLKPLKEHEEYFDGYEDVEKYDDEIQHHYLCLSNFIYKWTFKFQDPPSNSLLFIQFIQFFINSILSNLTQNKSSQIIILSLSMLIQNIERTFI